MGDPEHVPALGRHQDRGEQERDLDDDGLVWILQPDESALDASLKFDSAGMASRRAPGFPLLLRRNRRLNFDIRAVAQAGLPVVCGTASNVPHHLSRLALGRASVTPVLLKRL